MATACGLQNSEQVETPDAAIAAVRMIEREYLDLRDRYCQLLSTPCEKSQPISQGTEIKETL
jgi:hypothetical protein